jgi:hypothetical protein
MMGKWWEHANLTPVKMMKHGDLTIEWSGCSMDGFFRKNLENAEFP